MKVLYLVEWDVFSSNGVTRKIKAQYEAWCELGVDARLVVLSPQLGLDGKPLISGHGIEVVAHRTAMGGVGKALKALAIRAARKVVADFAPDVIYYRQSSWTPGILSVLDLAKVVVMEINSNDSNEIHQYGWLRAKYHLLTRRWLINRVGGFVCVGEDAALGYKACGKPIAVIGNGFDVNSVTPRVLPRNARPQLVFVGSAGQAWHGLDKIITMAEKLPEFDFHIVGDVVASSLENVQSYGQVNWAVLDSIYRKMDIGIASLALHRIGVNAISPLKTREYLAYGLPVVGAYDDPDLEGCEFFLKLPNEDGGVEVSINAVRDFVVRWQGELIDRAWVQRRIDSRVKEQQRVKFMDSLLRLDQRNALR